MEETGRDMEFTEQLREEHRVIEKALPMLERLASTFVGAEQVLEFFRVFVDQCHHGKEELYLFPALETRGVKRREGLLRELLVEHGVTRRYVRDIAGLIHPATVDENRDARQLLDDLVPELVALLQEHIEKEDTQLWPLAEQTLTAEDGAALLAGFADLQQNLIGERDYRRYLCWARLWR
jgi:hemerythrin-like domain-containing protein